MRVADRVLIRPGGRVPVDGTVREGASDLDVSRITGEPVPVAVTAGDTVAAGSISLTGGLELTVERTGSNSSYGRIVAAVRAAQQSEAPVQRLADRLAGWLVLVALAAAALTWVSRATCSHDLRRDRRRGLRRGGGHTARPARRDRPGGPGRRLC